MKPVTEGFIVGIRHPRETVSTVDLDMVPAGVCRVTVATYQENKIEGGAFGVADTLHVVETGVIDITLILEEEDVLEGDVTRGLKH